MKGAGSRNHRILIEYNRGTTRDAIGGVSDEWVQLGHRWANVRQANAREQIRADKQEGVNGWVAVIPYDPAVEQLSASMRVKHDGRTLYVVGVLRDEKGRENMTLQLGENV